MKASPQIQISISLQKNEDGTFSPLLSNEFVHAADGRRLVLKTRHGAIVAAHLHANKIELQKLEAGGPPHERTCSLLRQSIARQEKELERAERRPEVERAGLESLARLFNIAHGNSGQCDHVARFLLGCYNGRRFPFDFTRFRCLDASIYDDCLAVLQLDAQPKKEVHKYFEDGGAKFEALAKRWGLEAPLTQ